MFKKHALQVRFIKTNKSEPAVADTSSNTRIEEITTIISGQVNKGLRNVGAAVCAYVVLDTARKVLIAKASQ